jgi:hypothetical protein
MHAEPFSMAAKVDHSNDGFKSNFYVVLIQLYRDVNAGILYQIITDYNLFFISAA